MTTTLLSNLQFENAETFHQLDDRLQEVLVELDEILDVTDMISSAYARDIIETGLIIELENVDELGLANQISELIG